MEDTADHFFALAPGTRLDEYEIIRIIGQGSFGITYLAEDVNLGTRFAIKEYLPGDWAVRDSTQSVRPKSTTSRQNFEWGMDAFLKEARILAGIDHPNVVKVRRFFRANGTAYIVMGFVEGRGFSDILSKDYPAGGYPGAALSALLSALLDGLDAVHKVGIIHRDIKPGNILIEADGTPILIDFGAARNFQRTVAGGMTVIMTPGYAPIEQYAEDEDQGPFTDLFSLGAVAYRAISGRAPMEPYKRLSGGAFISATSLGSERYSASLLSAIDWAISIQPKDRPKSASDLKAALTNGNTQAQIDASIEIGPTNRVGETNKAVTNPRENAPDALRRKLALGIAACLALVLTIGTAIYMRGGSSAESEQARAPANPVHAENQQPVTRDLGGEAELREAERRAAEEARQEAGRQAAEAAKQEAERNAAETAPQEAERQATQAAASDALKAAEITKLEADRKAAEFAKQEAARKVADFAKQEAVRRAAEATRLDAQRRADEAARLAAIRNTSQRDGRWYADLPRNNCGSVRVQAIAIGNVIFGTLGLPTLTKSFRAMIQPDRTFASEGAINTIAGTFVDGALNVAVVNQCAKWVGPAQRTPFAQQFAAEAEIGAALIGKTVKVATGEAIYSVDGTYKISDRNGIALGRYTISDGAVCVRFTSGVDRCDAIFKEGASLVFVSIEGNRSILKIN